MNIFDLQSVSYSYPDGRVALSGINLEVKRGDRLALLGANASGKSTLLHILDGLYPVSSGAIKAFDRNLNDRVLEDMEFRRFFRSEVALMFQNADVQLFCGSVEEDIEFGPLQLGLPAEVVRQRVQDCASLCQVEHLLTRPPHALSGGEKKRVALASCLATNPSVLLLDEPTAGLDPRTEVWLLETLEQLSDAGKTIVIATHDLRLAAEFTFHAVALSEEHTLAASGATPDIVSDQELLLRLNLIHSHTHRHGKTLHSHPHAHSLAHEHPHTDAPKE